VWRELAAEFEDIRLRGPADVHLLGRIERELGQPVPPSLRALLTETDGMADPYGTDLVWPAERILHDNLSFRGDREYRTLYMPFDPLLFFGDSGGGDQFAFVRSPERDEVFVWEHETDSRRWISPDLESFLKRCLGGEGDDWYR
jgi:hypothetical protein